MPHATTNCDTFDDFIKLHQEQLILSRIPEKFWKTLFKKLKDEIFDAGDVFMIAKIEEIDGDEDEDEVDSNLTSDTQSLSDDASAEYTWQVMVKVEDGVRASDDKNIYLVDHAWTYRVDKARHQLKTIPGLLNRMMSLMDIHVESGDVIEQVDLVLSEMWKYNQTYKIGNAEMGSEAASPLFYIMDEFGCRIQHSDSPNAMTVPFCYVPRQISYTAMWPIIDMVEGDTVTRDYVPGVVDQLTKKLRLLPWSPDDMTHLSFDQPEYEDSFYTKFKVHETLPNLEVSYPGLAKDRNVKVYTNVDLVEHFLTDPRFELIERQSEADIIWSRNNVKDFKSLSENSPHQFVNQFPFEMVVTVKDVMSIVARRAAAGPSICPDTLESKPKWLQTTFNLSNELSQFVSYFQTRENMGLDNHWICKPWNLARSLDVHITNNLSYILRLPETGPKIACKYIENPVLLDVKDIGMLKFDLRFVVMVSSVEPLRICVHKKFNVRTANRPFSLDHFDDFEKHFTVMNYKGANVIEIVCADFISMFETQNAEFSWISIEENIYAVILELFTAATSQPAPKGIGHSPQSRSIYGVDIMLKWSTLETGERCVQPIILEVNFGPDNTRLCKAYKDFFNDIFSVLFLEDFEGRPVVVL